MFKSLKNKKGFTLIELMIVVAILGILAAVAIPMYINYQRQAKTSEVAVNIDAIKKGAISKYTASIAGKDADSYPILTLAPAAITAQKTVWLAADLPVWSNMVNWNPSGNATYAQYETVGTADSVPNANGSTLMITIGAQTNIDGDADNRCYALAVGDPNETIIDATCAVVGINYQGITEGGDDY